MSTAGSIRAGRAFVVIEAIDRTASVLRSVAARLDQFGTRLTNIGRNITGITFGMLLPIVKGAKDFANFDDALRKVEARSQGSAEEMDKIRQHAKDLGAATVFTASEIGELQAVLAQKKFSRREITEMTEAITNLAIAAGEGADRMEDARDAAYLVSGTIRSWGLQAEDANRVADLMTATVTASNSTMRALITTLQYAGPVAGQVGLSMEDTLAMVAAISQLNIHPSIIGTSIRNMAEFLTDPKRQQEFNQTLQNLNGLSVTFEDMNHNLLPVPSVLFAVGEAIKDLGTAQQIEMLHRLLGTRAVSPALGLVRGKNLFAEINDLLKKATGSAQRFRDIMYAGVGNALERVLSAAQAVSIALGEAFEPALIQLSNTTERWLNNLIDWVDYNRGLVAGIAASVVALFAFGISLVTTGLLVKLLAFSIEMLAAAITFLMAPIHLLIAFVPVLITTVIFLTRSIAALAVTITLSLLTALRTTAVFMATVLPGLFVTLMDLIGNLLAFALYPLIMVVYALGQAFFWLGLLAVRSLIGTLALLPGLLISVVTTMVSVFGAVLSALIIAFGPVAGVLIAVAAVVGIVLLNVAALQQIWGRMGVAAQQASATAVASTRAQAAATSQFGGVTQSVYNRISSSLSLFWQDAQKAFSSIARIGSSAFWEIKDDAMLVFNGIIQALAKGDVEAAWAIITAGIQLLWQDLVDAIKAMWEQLMAFLKPYMDVVKSDIKNVSNWIVRFYWGGLFTGNPKQPAAAAGPLIEDEATMRKRHLTDAISEYNRISMLKDMVELTEGELNHLKLLKQQVVELDPAAGKELDRAEKRGELRKKLFDIINATRDFSPKRTEKARNDFAATLGAWQNQVDDMVNEVGMTTAMAPNVGLERGSVEAAKKFRENLANNELLQQQIQAQDVQKKQLDALMNIDENTKKIEAMEGV